MALLPVGGGALVHWVNNHYLKGFGLPEIHIYDRDDESPPKYQECCDEVNSRGDGSWAVITSKREIENYLHPDAIEEERLGVKVAVTDKDDIPFLVAKAVHERSGAGSCWEDFCKDQDKVKEKVRKAKQWLNKGAVSKMTAERLSERDPKDELIGWLRRINGMLT